ncbi:pyridoxamine 5'-phosphate oxidase family protein [bacterium]|nr:pyridoxamine 5'-phosphate oxidase family protein [bacterium]
MSIPEEIKQLFKSIPTIAFSTVDKNGNPNVVAIASKKIVSEDTIWIIDTFFKKTKENILQNNKIAIAMWKDGRGYQIKGLATYHSEGATFEEAKEWILELKPKKIVKGVAEVKITEIFSITPNYNEAGKKIV